MIRCHILWFGDFFFANKLKALRNQSLLKFINQIKTNFPRIVIEINFILQPNPSEMRATHFW